MPRWDRSRWPLRFRTKGGAWRRVKVRREDMPPTPHPDPILAEIELREWRQAQRDAREAAKIARDLDRNDRYWQRLGGLR